MKIFEKKYRILNEDIHKILNHKRYEKNDKNPQSFEKHI